MYLNNKIINFLKSEINTIKLEDNKELYINFIISFVRECYKNKINQSSEDIYDLINSNIIKNVSNIKNYINLNFDKLKDKELPKSSKDICLITYIYDEFNTSWFQYVTSIFDNIFIINYSDKNFLIKNSKILKSKNYNNIDIDTLLLCNDLKYYFNKIFILEEYQKLGITINDTISYNTDYIKEYLNFDIKHNISIHQIIKINSETYNLNKPIYLYKSSNNHVIFNNTNLISKTTKIYSGALIVYNNIFENKLSHKNIYYKFINNPPKQINNIEDYVFNYNNVIDLKIKFNEVINFLNSKYKLEIYKPLTYNFIKKKSNLIKYNHYDYQFFNESLIINFSNNLNNDFLLLIYFVNLSKNLKKKIFIKWNHKIKLNEIFNDEFYEIDECKDNIKNYDVRKYDNFESNLLVHDITYINTKKLNIFYLEDKSFLKNIFNISWNNNLFNHIEKIDILYKNENLFLVCLNESNKKLISKVLNIESHNILLLNDFINNNKYKDILLIYILFKTKCIIHDKFKNYYKFLVNEIIDFNNLLYNSYRLYTEDNKILFKKIDYGISFDNLLITSNCDNEYLDFINDFKFIQKANIISNIQNWESYKLSFISTILSLGICLNTIIDKSKEKYIIISLNKKIDINFFYNNFIENNKFYYDNKILYISRILFEKLNGFNEQIDSKLIFYDFCERAQIFNYENIFRLEYNYELLSFWGKENIMKGNISKIKKNCYLIE